MNRLFRTGKSCVGLVLLFVLLAGRPAFAAAELHGADSSFRAEGVTILWAILKGASEENSFVYIRILHDAAAAPTLKFYRVEAVDPFSKERAWLMKGESLGPIRTLKIVRADFREKTERWFPFRSPALMGQRSRKGVSKF